MAPRQKPGVEFRRSTRNTSKHLAESEERIVLTLLTAILPYGIQREADFNFFYKKLFLSINFDSTYCIIKLNNLLYTHPAKNFFQTLK